MKRKSNTLADQVRQAMDDSGLTRYRIAQETGIDASALGKFYHGQRGLSLDALERLFDLLGLRLAADKKPKRKKGG
ncbi:MAG: helix-turn-helix domain-containing protein [Planctomycetaceae bacterium]